MEKKLLIGILIFTLAIVGVGVFFSSGTPSKAELVKTSGARAETPELNYDFGNIAYKGGLVQHTYKIKNTGNQELKIANLSTSCHCTKVYFEKNGQKGPAFGMKGSGGVSNWVGTLAPNEEGKLTAVFDPAFHGPQGTGQISRVVSAETNDPARQYIEFSFTGDVTK